MVALDEEGCLRQRLKKLLCGEPEACCKEEGQGNELGKSSLLPHSGWAVAEYDGPCLGQRKNVTALISWWSACFF